jgi:hypothetical protein
VSGRFDLPRSAIALFAAFLAAAVAVTEEISIHGPIWDTFQIAMRLPFIEALLLFVLAVWPSHGPWSGRRRAAALVMVGVALVVLAVANFFDQIPIHCALTITGCDHLPISVLGPSYRSWGSTALAVIPLLLFLTALPTGVPRKARTAS